MTLQALLTGFKFVYASKIILGLITLDMFAVFLGGATALLPIYAEDILFVGPTGLGFLAAALPLGSILCVFILNHRPPLQKAGRALLWAVTVFGLATIAFGFSKWFWFSLLMLFVCGAVDNISVVVRHTLVQMLTPDDKRGRVSAVNNLFIGTSNELGEFESGTVAQIFGPTDREHHRRRRGDFRRVRRGRDHPDRRRRGLDLAGNPEVRAVGRDLTPALGGLFSAHEKDFALAFGLQLSRFAWRARRTTRPSSKSTNSTARSRTCSTRRRCRPNASTRWKRKSATCATSRPGPAADCASQDDLQKLADQVQEIDKKRQEDQELILKEIEKLGKVSGGSTSSHKSPPAVTTTATDNPAATASGPQKGYDYTIQRGRHVAGHCQGVSRPGRSR